MGWVVTRLAFAPPESVGLLETEKETTVGSDLSASSHADKAFVPQVVNASDPYPVPRRSTHFPEDHYGNTANKQRAFSVTRGPIH